MKPHRWRETLNSKSSGNQLVKELVRVLSGTTPATARWVCSRCGMLSASKHRPRRTPKDCDTRIVELVMES
jgi:hypothetical protein